MQWGPGGRPRRSSITGIFTAQERRVQGNQVAPGIVPEYVFPVSSDDRTLHARLAFVLLCYAPHIGFAGADEGGAAPTSEAATPMQPSSPRPGYGSASTPRNNRASGQAQPVGIAVEAIGSPTATQRSHTPKSFLVSPRAAVRGDVAPPPRQLTTHEREAMAVAYDVFDSSLKLTLQFAENYAKKKRNDAQYLPTPDGFMVRQQKLKNPWSNVVMSQSVKSWSVRDLQEGDLFYFAIPFDGLTQFAVETVTEKARRHVTHLKKKLITTPQSEKGRRWLLHDCTVNVMPKVLHVLAELQHVVSQHGESNVRFPVFLFREKEMHLGERAIHPGNLVQVVEQVRFYFAQQAEEVLRLATGHLAHGELRDVMDGAPPQPPTIDDTESEHGQGYGHGDLSSESDFGS